MVKKLNLSVEILPFAKWSWKRCTGHDIIPEQMDDLIHLCSHRKSGLAASRGYGKTLMCVIIAAFLSSKGYLVTYEFNKLAQATQWYVWFRRIGWKVTQWRCYMGDWEVSLRLYSQGRGPRCDAIFNDEIGTVISDVERQNFAASQEMLSGSSLGFAKYLGTRDPNSIWSKYEQNIVIRPYNPIVMPWAVMQYDDAKLHNPQWYMDQEYHMKATPSGGKILLYLSRLNHHYETTRFGLDSNSSEGHCLIGSNTQNRQVYITEVHMFDSLHDLSDYLKLYHYIPLDVEENGQGGVVSQFLREEGISHATTWVTDVSKVQLATKVGAVEVFVPDSVEFDTCYANLDSQIWKDKKVFKTKDAHYFDAFVLSVGFATSYLVGVENSRRQSIIEQERDREMRSMY